MHKMHKFDKDYYAILGVEKDASPKEITTSYRKLALQYHPDVNPSDEAKERMPLLNEAYSVLGDADLRKQFDSAIVPTATTVTLVIYRAGTAVAITKGLRVYLDGELLGRVRAGGSMSFIIEPGKHKLRVKLDSTSSPLLRFSSQAGTTIGFAAGAHSVMDYLFRSLVSPEKALFIERIL